MRTEMWCCTTIRTWKTGVCGKSLPRKFNKYAISVSDVITIASHRNWIKWSRSTLTLVCHFSPAYKYGWTCTLSPIGCGRSCHTISIRFRLTRTKRMNFWCNSVSHCCHRWWGTMCGSAPTRTSAANSERSHSVILGSWRLLNIFQSQFNSELASGKNWSSVQSATACNVI